MDTERYQALKEEVDKLLSNDFIKESFYPSWRANPVLIKKPNGKWRTCVDFTDLNKAYPKDNFPLPRIDQLVDATSWHPLLSFMEPYPGHNQIPMHVPDQEHTSFITDHGLYCYKVMSFGLKNVEATYQLLVNMMFKEQIGKTMQVYMDNMLVKSKATVDHVAHIFDTFVVLRKYRMKLNLLKCAFGVAFGKFLGFMVNHRGIKANPKKIQALTDMRSPSKTKEVQSLTRRVATLNKFISRAIDKCHPFSDSLKGSKRFLWDDKCEQAFRSLKKYLSKLSLFSKPIEGEPLYMYLAIKEHAISRALIREENKVQWSVYYISKQLVDV